MSGGKDRRSRASKTQGWEEAGGEFYQESYPADLEGMQRDPSKIATLLPSKQTRNATTRRVRPAQGQDTKGGTRRRASISTVARRGSQYHEMQVATMPDLSENLINEERTWEEIREIKSMPVPMAQKREMKAQLQNATKLRLQGFEQIKWRRRKAWQSFRSKWGEYRTKLELWRMSLKTIEGNFGTGVVAYFLFLRWLMFLNLLVFLLIFGFVVLPHLVLREPRDLPCDDLGDPTSVQCCSESYENVTRAIQFSVLDLIQGTGFMEGTLLFYGMYTNQIYGYSPMEDQALQDTIRRRQAALMRNNTVQSAMLVSNGAEDDPVPSSTILYYDLPLVYVIITAICYVIALVAIMRAVVRQFKDRIAEGEGLFYQYCNLVFGGWDFCIHNQKSADIKHKALYNEIKSLLHQKRFEYERSNRSREFMLKLIAIRMLVNLVVFIILLLAAITIYVLFNVSMAKLEPNFTPSHPVSFGEVANRTYSWSKSWATFSSQRSAISFTSTSTPLLSASDSTSSNSTMAGLPLEERLLILFYEFLPYLAIVCLNLIVPLLFSYLVKYEKYSPLFVIKISLFRTVFLRLASLAVLLSRFYFLITPMSVTNKLLLINASAEQALNPTTTTTTTTTTAMPPTSISMSEPSEMTIVANLTTLATTVATTTLAILSSTVLPSDQPLPEPQQQQQQQQQAPPLTQQCYDEANGAPQCWETFVGQQFYKLFIVDFATHFLVTFFVNFPRALFARHSSSRLAKFIGEQEFELSKHVLDVIYSQTLCWLGMFYTPFLPAIASLLTFLMFYIKKFACLVNSNPSTILYRASRSNSLFMSTLLISFTVAIVPVVYALAELVPSRSCGPFRGLPSVWDRAINAFMKMPLFFQNIIFYFGTASFAIPCFVVLTFFIYYYYAVSTANRHMVQVLKHQLVLEGHDKQFLLSRLGMFIKQQQEYQKRMMRQAAEQQMLQQQQQQQQQQQHSSSISSNNVIPAGAHQQQLQQQHSSSSSAAAPPTIVPPPRTNSVQQSASAQTAEPTPALPPRADRDSKPSSRDRPKDLPPPLLPGGPGGGSGSGGGEKK
ncbi:transmembrane channel-like protein 7 [Anopheles aquasalis]|uniref:transmembrane channel-like protein 7 n=1 Tax=Anopheles aquasalis TaxID=42839 RepID=UPI00215AF8B1|nr:transmembrane channel-like protein 7 [Anopheles aquasalis]XP_050089910.1 transmembrane channel-like protein 7 [Anopheles aquasalis]